MRSFSTYLLCATLLSSAQSWAWGDMGHKLVGGIAEATMSEKAKNFVRGILGIEPLYVAAVFPDQVRDDARFATRTDPKRPETEMNDFSPFHFCEIPTGYSYFNRPKRVKKDCHGVMRYTVNLLRDKRALRETKMIALRYLVHVVGDIHQPLHVGNGFDRGANACFVKTSRDQRINLHSFWDEYMVEEIRESYANPAKKNSAPKYYGDFFKALKAKHKDLISAEGKKKYGQGDVVDWLLESQALRETIYPDAPGSMAKVKKGEEYKNRPYCNWYVDQDLDRQPAPGSVIDETKLPVMTSEYVSRFRDTAELQIIKAGLRLAYILDYAAEEAETLSRSAENDSIDDEKEKTILKEVQEALKNIL